MLELESKKDVIGKSLLFLFKSLLVIMLNALDRKRDEQHRCLCIFNLV